MKFRFLLAVPLLAMMSPAGADEIPADVGFAIWLQNYRAKAIERGLKPEWLDATLANTVYLPRVVSLDRTQPDDSGKKTLFSDYLERRLTADRISAGQKRAAENAAVLRGVEAKTGVPAQLIVAIWGMETSYGRITGNFDLPSSLATLAYDGRREALFTRELDALVRMVGEKGMARSQLTGSWAGAFGQSQFLPSSYLSYAVDGDGDGKADIWNSTADTFASIGNYLKLNGWQAGVPWGFRAIVPNGFDRATVANPETPKSCVKPMSVHSRWLSAREWRDKGFRPINAAWPADMVQMTLVEPDGPGQGAYLTTASYRAIMQYNCSNFYALSVALLSDAVEPALRP